MESQHAKRDRPRQSPLAQLPVQSNLQSEGSKSVALSGQALAVQEMFDRIAPRYDLLNRLLSLRQDVRWRREMCGLLPTVCPDVATRNGSGAGCALLDLACGTGDVLAEVLRSRPDYGRLVGFDLSREMLGVASRRFAGKNNSALGEGPVVELVQGTATALPFGDKSFEAITIAFGLRNVDDRPAALREMARVVAPHGRVFVLEFFPLPRSIMGFVFEIYFKRILPLVGGLLSDRRAYRYLPDSVATMPSFGEFREVARSAGLKVVASKSWLFGGCRLVVMAPMGDKGNGASS
jgi:demethylmenaquinone methyltransferase/2-methoxy-6-polyprenyl-1,4-benzoquinol methylase